MVCYQFQWFAIGIPAPKGAGSQWSQPKHVSNPARPFVTPVVCIIAFVTPVVCINCIIAFQAAKFFADDNNDYTDAFEPTFMPDEHYFIALANKFKLPWKEAPIMLVEWPKVPAPRPYTLELIDASKAVHGHHFVRKITKTTEMKLDWLSELPHVPPVDENRAMRQPKKKKRLTKKAKKGQKGKKAGGEDGGTNVAASEEEEKKEENGGGDATTVDTEDKDAAADSDADVEEETRASKKKVSGKGEKKNKKTGKKKKKANKSKKGPCEYITPDDCSVEELAYIAEMRSKGPTGKCLNAVVSGSVGAYESIRGCERRARATLRLVCGSRWHPTQTCSLSL